MISIVVPCYNEQEALPLFYNEIMAVLKNLQMDYELLFINDGSKDNTLTELKTLAAKDPYVIYLSFSRNFGKESAILAGLTNAKGNYVAVMDADLQDPPSILPQMLDILKSEKYHCVATRQGEPIIRSWFARQFYKIMNHISDADIVDGARDFRLINREMVDAILSMNEYNRFSKGIFGWVGFKTYWLPYENIERIAGTTKWNFYKLFKYAIDGIINFSSVPLSMASWFGVIMTFFSFITLIFIVFRRIIFGDPVAGWASMISITMFIGGLQLFCVGIMGQYIAKMYLETKKRPHFIISETNGKEIQKIK